MIVDESIAKLSRGSHMSDPRRSKSRGAKPFHVSACVLATFLMKVAKHLALIACLMIIGRSTGRFIESQVVIFLTILSAALLHSIGRVLQRPLPSPFHRRFKL
jgi:hypothetical protein